MSFTPEQIQQAIKETASMGAAAKYLKIDWRTFKSISEKLGLYKPSNAPGKKYLTSDILEGKYPHYPTSHLSKRLVLEGVIIYECISCKITEYNGLNISLELDHIDGNNSNHSLSNLRLLCPNCHSQTHTYRSKKLTFIS